MNNTFPDNSVAFRKFQQSIPKSSGQMPIPALPNIKTVVLEWLDFSFSRFKLKNPVHILGDYPSETLLVQVLSPTSGVGGVGKISFSFVRGVSVVALNSRKNLTGVGNVVNTEIFNGNINETKYGWHEETELEVTYWSFDSRDRDFGGDLISLFMLEGWQSQHFLKNGLITFEQVSSYDTATDKIVANTMLYMKVATFKVSRIFFGTVTFDYSSAIIEEMNFSVNPIVGVVSNQQVSYSVGDRYNAPHYNFRDRLLDVNSLVQNTNNYSGVSQTAILSICT